jgi:glucokinase
MHILLDIGGSNTRLAISHYGRVFCEPVIYETPQNFDEAIKKIKETFYAMTNEKKASKIICGLPGSLDKKKSKLVNAPHLKKWIKKPIKRTLEKEFRAEVHLENDAALVGLGEANVGPGRGYNIAVYITVSTGVGGVRIVDGKIDNNSLGFEPGHQIIDVQEHIKGNGGELEQIVSGSGIRARYKKNPEEIDDPSFWKHITKYIAYGLHNVTTHWSPDIIIVGGSIMKSISITLLRTEYKKICKVFHTLPKIEKAYLDNIGGMYGALAVLRQQVIQDEENHN